MSNFKFEPRDIIVLVVTVGCFVLIALGFNGEIKALLGMVLGYYFGLYTKTPKVLDNGQSNPA